MAESGGGLGHGLCPPLESGGGRGAVPPSVPSAGAEWQSLQTLPCTGGCRCGRA